MASLKFLGSIIETNAMLLHKSLRECLVVTPFEISPMMLSVEAKLHDDESSSFDDDKKPKRMISRLSQQVQDQNKIKINFKIQEMTSRRIKIQEKMISQGKY